MKKIIISENKRDVLLSAILNESLSDGDQSDKVLQIKNYLDSNFSKATSDIGTFDENGERVINLDDNTHIKVGMVVFKDKKTGKLACMPQEKLLQFYDLYNDEKVEG